MLWFRDQLVSLVHQDRWDDLEHRALKERLASPDQSVLPAPWDRLEFLEGLEISAMTVSKI